MTSPENWFVQRRRFLRAASAAVAGAAAAPAAHALMAGSPPDSPAARADPNTAASPWTGAVSVIVGGSPYSGVVIGPRHVLTAAHVAGGAAPAGVQVVLNLTAAPVTLGVTAVSTYPGTSFPYDDLAVLRLAQPVPAGCAVYPVVDTAQPGGALLTLVGYGGSGSGAAGPSVAASSTVKRKGRNVADLLTDRLDESGRTSPFFVYDFDGPSGNGALGGTTLGNAVETCVAGGDSGSGAFIDTASGPALYGLSTVALTFVAGSTSSAFGAGGGGLVLAHAPYIAWLRAQTDQTVTLLSQADAADVPVAPAWALALMGAALAAGALRRRR